MPDSDLAAGRPSEAERDLFLAFDDFARSAPTPILVVAATGRVRCANRVARAQFGLGPGDLLGDILDEPTEQLTRLLERGSGVSDGTLGSLKVRAVDGTQSQFQCWAARIGEANGTGPLIILRFMPQGAASKAFIGLTTTVNRLNAEIHARRASEAALQRLLMEKEALLRELHHRVRNNLQLLLTLVAMEGTAKRERSAEELLSSFKSRLNAMAAIQNLLHDSERLSEVNIGELITRISRELQFGMAPEAVRVTPRAQDLILSADDAVSLGLMVNELVTNSLKHAFPRGMGGEIRVLLEVHGGEAILTVADDGVPAYKTSVANGLGQKIVSAMAAKLNGRIETTRVGGTTVTVRFPISPP